MIITFEADNRRYAQVLLELLSSALGDSLLDYEVREDGVTIEVEEDSRTLVLALAGGAYTIGLATDFEIEDEEEED